MKIKVEKCPIHGWLEVSVTLVVADIHAFSIGWFLRTWGLGVFYTVEDPAYDFQVKVGPAYISYSQLKTAYQNLDEKISEILQGVFPGTEAN
jgi:hypothetical protein